MEHEVVPDIALFHRNAGGFRYSGVLTVPSDGTLDTTYIKTTWSRKKKCTIGLLLVVGIFKHEGTARSNSMHSVYETANETAHFPFRVLGTCNVCVL